MFCSTKPNSKVQKIFYPQKHNKEFRSSINEETGLEFGWIRLIGQLLWGLFSGYVGLHENVWCLVFIMRIYQDRCGEVEV